MRKFKDIGVVLLIAGIALLSAGNVAAGDAKICVIDDKNPQVCCKEDPAFCDFFGKTTLYKNENACLIQSVALTGRYHGQHHSTTLDFENGGRVGASFWEHRRYRTGIKVKFLNDFTFYNEWNISDVDLWSRRSYFNNIDVIGVKWAPNDNFYVNVGKQKVHITREWTTSSKNILTFERSHITNEVIASAGKPYGVAVGFKALGLKHELGAWLNGADLNSGTSVTNQPDGPRGVDWGTRGGASYRLAYDWSDNTGVFFDYLYTNNSEGLADGEGNADRLEMSAYNHVFALGTETEWDLGHCGRKSGLITDFVYAIDREARTGNANFGGTNNLNAGEDVFGIVILPYYDLTEKLQLVGRYAYASESRMHRPQRAPFSEDVTQTNAFADGGRPVLEDVHTFYLGLNFRICGDNLKFMAGYEYLTGEVESSGSNQNGGVTGDTWMLGVRTYW